MNYYDPNDKSPRRWALAAAAAYTLLLGVSFASVSFDFHRIAEKRGDTILVDFSQPPLPEITPPPTPSPTEPRMHDASAPEEHTEQVAGKDEKTQTPNPKALFQMSKSGADEPADAGNQRAPKGEDKAHGSGSGLNPDGLEQLDKGLQKRGLVGNWPEPRYPGSKSGRINIRVTVGPRGDVTGASFEPIGSTESDADLVAAALAAARKTRFTESRAAVQGGIITYTFRMK
ncbi:MAG: TonB family protein [Alistipes sp.]